ncbi:DUF1902 domain-containing protein [Brevundimonas sp.]|jgi:hypothetical protein|uniref:DUF1902 domain-containing protein n=1 Tax=Brevundimonas sp. TaxID=1871086 RepID=UPI002E10248A|nr:DUF1902 domain-containing protein [Brevundimonas sp.]
MNRVIVVKASYDADAGVWITESADVHGLRIEAATLEGLIARIPGAVQDLLDDDPAQDIPIEIVAHASTRVSASLAA